MKVSVVGLGKLGSVWATVLAGMGIQVIGYDKDPDAVQAINWHKPAHYEPGLEEAMLQSGEYLVATTNLVSAIIETDVTFILVPTPTKSDGSFDSSIVESVIVDIAGVLKNKRGAHMVVVSSTVMPGTCDGLYKLLIEKSGRDVDSVGLCYCPEFIALGQAIEGFNNPPLALVGAGNQISARYMEEFFQTIYYPETQIVTTTLEEAELIKVSLNFWLTVKISFGNRIAGLCAMFGANADQVMEALECDPRINTSYMRAGTPFGGPCFPRDAQAFSFLERQTGGGSFSLAETVIMQNMLGYVELRESVCRAANERGNDARVGILGRAFKEKTDVVTESVGDRLRAELEVDYYDPVLGGDYDSAQELVDDCEVVVIANMDPEFKRLTFNGGHYIIDPWGMVNPEYAHAVGAKLESRGR